ncbi:MAG: hypothetical protein ACOCG4_02215 [Methanoculleus sp.]
MNGIRAVGRALILVITESHVKGVSTRNIKTTLRHFGITNICPDDQGP